MAIIYKIENSINGSVYVGATKRTLKRRWLEHKYNLGLPRYSKFPLYIAMKDFGVENFSVEVLEECDDALMDVKEIYWIEKFNSFKTVYNATFGGAGKPYIENDKIFKMWQEGKTVVGIAEETGYDKGAIAVHLKTQGVLEADIKDRSSDWSKVPVVMLDKDGTAIKEFESQIEAGRYFGGGRSIGSHISEVCRGMRKTCCGYRWKFKEIN